MIPPSCIKAGDTVNVTLAQGGVLNEYIVMYVPGNNELYWCFDSPEGVSYTVGTTMVSIEVLIHV
jgi:hypothetical protein